VTPALILELKKGFNYGGVKVFYDFPPLGSKVIVKIQDKNPRTTTKMFEEDVARENSVHKELTDSPNCYKIPMASKPTCISDYAPKFYLSFVINSNGGTIIQCITVMDSAGDMSSKKFVSDLKKSRSPVRFVNWYLSFEKAITSLWLAGYAHGDLHRDNIMVNSKTGKVNLIDFGFAIKLPPAFIQSVADGASYMIAEGSNKSFADIWTNGLINGKQTLVDYTNRIMTGRGISEWYNPDYKILQTVYNEIPKGGKQLIPSIRSKEWSIVRHRKIAPNAFNMTMSHTLSPRKTPPSPFRRMFKKAPASPTNSLESGEIRVTPTKKKTPWKPRDGKYWANEPSPSTYVSARSVESTPMSPTPVSKREPTPKAPTPKAPTPKAPTPKAPTPKAPTPKAPTPKAPTPKAPTPKAPTPKAPTPKAPTPKAPTPKATTPKATTPKVLTPFNKVNAKGRKVFKDEKGRTFVKQGEKKVYVKKLFTPKAAPVESTIFVNENLTFKPFHLPGSPMTDTGKVDAKKRKVFKDSKGRTYVKPANKKVYVKKLFTPKASAVVPSIATSPVANTGKVNAKKRKVFKDTKGRTYVKQNNKKVYVKKLFTPR
jgi:serine/threonine protein kinase